MRVHSVQYRDGAWQGGLPDLAHGPVLAYAFSSPSFIDNPAPFEELSAAFPGITLAGCSSAGEIFGSEVADDSVTLALAQFDTTTVRSVSTPITCASESEMVGAHLAESLCGEGLTAVTVFADGLHVNGTDLARGMVAKLPDDVVVSGGLAADGDRFERTWVLADGVPQQNQVMAVGLYGNDLEVTYGTAGGWGPFGPVRLITRSEGSVLYELDGKPALDLYKEYLGDRADGLPATALLFPLQVTDSDGRSIVRTILGVDEEQRSMTFAGDVPEGSDAQLMRASFDALVDGADDAGEQAGVEQAALCLAVSCVGRRLVLGEDCEEEVEATAAHLPHGSHQVGFYSYGELAPAGFQACDLHNQTMTLTNIVERVGERVGEGV
jgi:hypothetical protein